MRGERIESGKGGDVPSQVRGPIIRDVRRDDLPQVYDVYYADAAGAEAPPRPAVLLDIRHEYAQGSMVVAEEAGTVLGFGSATRRGQIWFLSSLFVRPTAQSRRLGGAILEYLMPRYGYTCCTLSSGDRRALALYTRFGMRPRWPNLLLQAASRLRQTPLRLPSAHIEEADPSDEALIAWDAAIGGRPRLMDHRYWVEEERAIPLWFSRWGRRIGYGYVRLGAGTFQHPDAATIGPIGAHNPDDALACTLSAVRWAAARAAVLRIDVPGPHSALAPLLAAGFRIVDVDTFCLAGETAFADPQTYISSGGSLF